MLNSQVPTPALFVDLDVFERNLERMHGFFRDRPCKIRPHLKAHKTPAIARLQQAAGATVGFCCANVWEAEVFAAEGFDDLLIANEVCDPAKVDRLVAVSKQTTLTVAVDSRRSADILAGTDLRVLIDVNVGLPRCGVPPADAVELARVATRNGLHVVGVMGYEGHATAIEEVDKRAHVAQKSMDILLGVAEELRAESYDISIVSAGSTLTYDVTGTIDGITEVQVGSYALMDTEFSKSSPFEEGLRCLATVVSVYDNIAVLDCGLKTLTIDHGNPKLPDDVPADVLFLSDEHTTLITREGWTAQPGDRVWVRPSHVDPTVNLHDRLHAYRGDEVIEVWNIAARGYGPA
jgi:D-serine deaminase-like pyridoxal phosphate-dependent protein